MAQKLDIHISRNLISRKKQEIVLIKRGGRQSFYERGDKTEDDGEHSNDNFFYENPFSTDSDSNYIPPEVSNRLEI